MSTHKPEWVTSVWFEARCERCTFSTSHTLRTEYLDALTLHARRCSGQVREWENKRSILVDLDDTSYCRQRGACALCGSENNVTTGTFGTPQGVFCLRVCVTCTNGPLPALPPRWVEVIDAVAEHCEHLGVTLDEMSAVLTVQGRRTQAGAR